jgi:hypothetical protein
MNDPDPAGFISVLLQNLAEAIELRGKAIRYHGILSVSRLIEEPGERLNVDITAILGHRVRLSVWSDGAIWLNVNKPGPRRAGGWEYNRKLRGQIEKECPAEIVSRLESTIAFPAEADRIWQNFLAVCPE